MTKWKWPQSDGKIWRVEINYKDGIIEVFDEDDKLMMKKENLSRLIIMMIETNFFNKVATRKLEDPMDNPMYA